MDAELLGPKIIHAGGKGACWKRLHHSSHIPQPPSSVKKTTRKPAGWTDRDSDVFYSSRVLSVPSFSYWNPFLIRHTGWTNPSGIVKPFKYRWVHFRCAALLLELWKKKNFWKIHKNTKKERRQKKNKRKKYDKNDLEIIHKHFVFLLSIFADAKEKRVVYWLSHNLFQLKLITISNQIFAISLIGKNPKVVKHWFKNWIRKEKWNKIENLSHWLTLSLKFTLTQCTMYDGNAGRLVSILSPSANQNWTDDSCKMWVFHLGNAIQNMKEIIV